MAATVGAPVARAQAPTPEQIQVFKSLPPDQQRGLVEQAMPPEPGPQAKPLEFPETSRPKAPPPEAPSLPQIPEAPDLKPFGCDIFSSVPTTFAPATDIPIPAEYVVGPGDALQVQLIGERGGSYSLTVGRDGTVDFPELGPIAVAGLRFAAARSLIEQRVAEEMIGMRASVSMGPLRSIQIFVLGEAKRPGSYTVSGLSTITNALFASGGVKPIGSLRNIQLKRAGRLVQQLDPHSRSV